MSMRFSELMKSVAGAVTLNGLDADVNGIAYDSRKVEPGNLFIAMKGGSFDGHRYITAAIEAGAAAVVAEEKPNASVSVPYAVASNGREAMGYIAAAYYGYPSRKIKLIGVTGTSGKTTVTHLIQAVFNHTGQKAGLIGTLGAKVGDESISTEHTTPESADIQKILNMMVEKGAKVAAMEVSSHGLYQGRVLGCEFDCGVFTNIARDHLDFHKTPEAYLDAKLMLFRDYPRLSDKEFTAVVNADDPAAALVIASTRGSCFTFGYGAQSDVKAQNAVVTEKSVAFDLVYGGSSTRVELNIGGAFNVYNALAAASAAITLGLGLDDIAKGLSAARSVAGRFESVSCGQNFGVIVDYAHTPDELENVLMTARELTGGRLIAVFGCGGDRDRGKRPIMGGIGARIADVVVVTSDNPRTEEPEAIIEDIMQGIGQNDKDKITVLPDRYRAIQEAIRQAREGDTVVIAGKGHEDYQIFADRTIHFDDREVAREILTELVG